MNTLIILLAPLLLLAPHWANKEKSNKTNSTLLKIIVVMFFLLGLFRFFFVDRFVEVISGNFSEQVTTQFSLTYQAILRWGYNIALSVLPIAVFMKNRLFRNVAVTVCLLFSVLTAIAYNDFMVFFLQPPITNSIIASDFIRHALFSLELILSIYIPLNLIIIEKHFINYKNKKEVAIFFLSLIFIAFACIPTYLPQSLLGYTSYSIQPFSLLTMLWLIFTILETLLIYLLFRFKNKELRLAIVLFLALALMVQYNSVFLVEISFKRFPLQLCNLGAYMVLLAILFKKQSFFNFVYIANLLGTILAMFVPTSRLGILEFATVHYMLVHMQLFVAVATCLTLRIFSAPNKDAIKHYFIGFTIYFLVVLLSGSLINATMGKNTVDYFYLFSTTIVGYFPFLIRLKTELTIGAITLYPAYQLFIYCAFSAFAVLLYFITKKIYAFAEDYLFLRKLRIEMRIEKNKYANRQIPPLEYIDD